MISRQSDKNNTKQVRIDSTWHKELKILAAKHGKTLRELVEYGFPETLEAFKDD